MMETYVMLVRDDKIVIQEASYIEDGCYIEIIGAEITLYEIPMGGGEEIRIGIFPTIMAAIEKSKTLT